MNKSITETARIRKDAMKKMKKKGASYEEIASKFGISKQRVHQIINGYKMMKA